VVGVGGVAEGDEAEGQFLTGQAAIMHIYAGRSEGEGMQTDIEYAEMLHQMRQREYRQAQQVEDDAWAALATAQAGHDHTRVAVSAVVDSMVRDAGQCDWAWCEKVRDESWSMRMQAAAVWHEAMDRKHNAARAVDDAREHVWSFPEPRVRSYR